MRAVLILIYSLIGTVALGQPAMLSGKTWAYKTMAIIYQQDTLSYYDIDSSANIWYLGRVNLSLKPDGQYIGKNIYGDTTSGTWQMPSLQTIIVDQDTNQVVSLSGNQFTTTSLIRYKDNIYDITGTLLTVFYSIPTSINYCESLRSGTWTSAANWSCGHEPTVNDIVIINVGHIINVSTQNAQAQRVIFHGGTINFSSSDIKIFIKQ